MNSMTLEKWNEYIAKSNQEFLSLPLNKQMVWICRDFLAQLKLGRIRPRDNIWVSNRETVDDCDQQFNEILKSKETCEACLVGGLFLAAVERCNDLTFRDVRATDEWGTRTFGAGAGVLKYLERFTTREQVRLMEIAFETGEGWFNVCDESPDEDKDAAAFGRLEVNLEIRMRLIAENIIANDGLFVPSKKPVYDEDKGDWVTSGYTPAPDPITVAIVP